MIRVSPFLLSMIYGLLISDAGLRIRSPNANANFYLTWSRSLCEKVSAIFAMHGIEGTIRPHSSGPAKKWYTKTEGWKSKTYPDGWRYETKYLPIFTRLHKKWYSNSGGWNSNGYWRNGTKVVPAIAEITDVMLAFWHMGDGNNAPETLRSRRITLSTNSFNLDSLHYLVKKFRKIGIHSRIEKTTPSKSGELLYRIVISRAADVNLFIDKIEPHVFEEFTKDSNIDGREFKNKIARPKLIRTAFTELKTIDIKRLEQNDPDAAKQVLKKKVNKHRRKKYQIDPEPAKIRAHDYYYKNREMVLEKKKARLARKK